MSTTETAVPVARKPLRLWPGVIVAIVILAAKFLVPLVDPGATVIGILAAAAGTLVILLWWLFFSRAAWIERIGAIVVLILGTLLTKLVVDPSIAGGMMGRMLYIVAIPATFGPVFVAWAVATRNLPDAVRRATMVVAILLACGVWTLARTDGVKGEAAAQLAWRWTPTAEERLLAQPAEEPKAIAPVAAPAETPAAEKRPDPPAAAVTTREETSASASAPAPVRTAEWPGFRGPQRDGAIPGVRIATDWTTSPPVQLWRRPVGPGWSSFAVAGDLIYTQEQRGEHELVSAYRLSTGEPVWRHLDTARFYESNGGAGPRGTPTVHHGRVYAMGATGIVNALDAFTGARIWSRNAETDTGAPRPGWGFAASPLVVADVVIAAASGRLVAYDINTGTPRWTRTTGGGGYSSPHLVTMNGVTQVLLLNGAGVTSVAPSDGRVFWEHKAGEGVSIVQPQVVGQGEVLVAAGDMMGGTGLRRLAVARASDESQGGWAVQERWTSRGLKPYFNDFVVHKGYAFGFDGTILSCINLQDGERMWKGGRYGAGQMVLLPEQDLLLVLSEDGDLVLVGATPEKHTEIAKFKALDSKTWNHPVLVGDVLLVRNGEEMAAFKLRR